MYLHNFEKVSTFIFDVDGVLTDGSLHVLPSGEYYRVVNVKDGYAIQLAIKKGYKIAIISGGNITNLVSRLNSLGINDIFFKVRDKLQVYKDYIAENELKHEEVLFMGDDLPDYEVLKQVGMATCPADAVSQIKNIVHFISSIPGGKGCIREVIEKTLSSQGKWVHED